MSKFSEKGVSIYLAVMMMTILLAVVLGMGTILFSQIRTIRRIGFSVVALYAADTGIERELKIIFKDNEAPENTYSEILANDASFTVDSVCCHYEKAWCSWATGDCTLAIEDKDCVASYYCVRSTGTYNDVKRAIEVGI